MFLYNRNRIGLEAPKLENKIVKLCQITTIYFLTKKKKRKENNHIFNIVSILYTYIYFILGNRLYKLIYFFGIICLKDV